MNMYSSSKEQLQKELDTSLCAGLTGEEASAPLGRY